MDEAQVKYYNRKSDEEIREEIAWLLNSEYYEENNFTEMVRDISKKKKWTEKQRGVLIKHLAIQDGK